MSTSTFKFKPAVPGLECVHQGKARDTFAIPGHPELLLVVATDRVSTHNVVHKSIIPMKGCALTALTVFWMKSQLPGIKTHLMAFGSGIFKYLPRQKYPDDLFLRALVIRKLDMIPVEFIFRSRMAGSLLKDYYQKGLPNPYGLELPPGLQLMSPFENTVFTPTDKSETDDPLNAIETMMRFTSACQLALKVYEMGRAAALQRGIEIIDGKFEVGVDPENGRVVLGDECLTPDSCRFVRADGIVVGQEPAWLDKQYLRVAAERMWAGGKVPLDFSPDVITETMRRYEAIVGALTGASLAGFQLMHLR